MIKKFKPTLQSNIYIHKGRPWSYDCAGLPTHVTHLVVYIYIIRYAMDTRGLPDIYIFNPQPRALGVYIRQTIGAHGTTIMYIRTHVATGKHTQHTHTLHV